MEPSVKTDCLLRARVDEKERGKVDYKITLLSKRLLMLYIGLHLP